MVTTIESNTERPPVREWKDVLEELLPAQGQWSEEEYLVLTGQRNQLVEFTDGRIELLPMPTAKHQKILKFLFLAFCNFVDARGGLVLFAPLRLRIRPGKFREPDLLLVVSKGDPRAKDQFWEGADLALEVVSEDKPERDLVDKRVDYAEGRIPEYWIVNPLTETITVLTLRGDAYQEAGVFKRGEAAASTLLEGFSIPVAPAFDVSTTRNGMSSV